MSEDVKKYIADMTAFPGSFHGAGNLKPYDPNAPVEPASDEVVDRASILPLGRTAAGKVVPAVPNLLATHPTFRGDNGDDSGLLTGPARGSPNSMSDRAHNTTAGFSIPAALKAAYDSAAAMAGDQLAYWRGDYGKDNEKTAIGEDGRLYWKGTDRLAQQSDPGGIEPFIAVAGATGLNSVTGGLMASGSKAMTPIAAAASKAGEPLRGYHGTSAQPFDKFDPAKVQANAHLQPRPYFADVPGEASGYAMKHVNDKAAKGGDPRVIPVDIGLKNPFNDGMINNKIGEYNYVDPALYERITGRPAPRQPTGHDVVTDAFASEARKYVEEKYSSQEIGDNIYKHMYDKANAGPIWERVYDRFAAEGYDGFYDPGRLSDYDHGQRHYGRIIPFERGTVRSATTGETLFSGGKDAGPLGTALANAARQHHEAPGVQQAIKRAADVPLDERMLVTHNLSGDNLSFTDRYFGGQLPVPSLAVGKIGQPLDGFGEIGLVGAPGLAKPSGKNPVFGADAYSKRFPDLNVKLFKGDRQGLERDLRPFSDSGRWPDFMRDIEGHRFDRAAEAEPMLQRYLHEKGEPPFTREQRYEVRDRLLKDPEYKQWAADYLRDATSQSDVRITRYNEDTGNRRYSPFNLENTVKALKGGADGEGFDYGLPNARSRLTPRFTSLKDIQEGRGRIQPSETWRPQADALTNEILNKADSLPHEAMKYPPKGTYPRDDMSAAMRRSEAMMRAVGQGRHELQWDYNLDKLPGEFTDWMADARGRIRDLGTDYFEAKPQRAVALGEFSGAIVPNDVPSTTMDLLKKYGINRIEPYDKGDRTAALRKFSDIAFSNPKESGPVSAAVANAAHELPMDKASRLKRAEEMGYDTSQVWYHGTPKAGFNEFELPTDKKTRDTGVFFGDNKQLAQGYSGRAPMVERPDPAKIIADMDKYGDITRHPDGSIEATSLDGYTNFHADEADLIAAIKRGDYTEKKPGIYPVYLKKHDPSTMTEVDWEGRSWDGQPDPHSDGPEARPHENYPYMTTDQVARQLIKDAGEKGVTFKDVWDTGPHGYAEDGRVRVEPDPRNIRHVDADFDPAKKDSANIFAANPPMSAAAAVLANMASRRKSDHDDKADSKSKKATGGTVTMNKNDRRKIISRALDVVRRAAGGSVPGFADGGDTAKAVLSESTRSPVPDWLLDQQRSVRDGMPMPEGVERRFPSAPFEPFADVAGVGAELTGVPSMVRGYGNLTDEAGDGWTKAKGVAQMAAGALPVAAVTRAGAPVMNMLMGNGLRAGATGVALAAPVGVANAVDNKKTADSILSSITPPAYMVQELEELKKERAAVERQYAAENERYKKAGPVTQQKALEPLTKRLDELNNKVAGAETRARDYMAAATDAARKELPFRYRNPGMAEAFGAGAVGLGMGLPFANTVKNRLGNALEGYMMRGAARKADDVMATDPVKFTEMQRSLKRRADALDKANGLPAHAMDYGKAAALSGAMQFEAAALPEQIDVLSFSPGHPTRENARKELTSGDYYASRLPAAVLTGLGTAALGTEVGRLITPKGRVPESARTVINRGSPESISDLNKFADYQKAVEGSRGAVQRLQSGSRTADDAVLLDSAATSRALPGRSDTLDLQAQSTLRPTSDPVQRALDVANRPMDDRIKATRPPESEGLSSQPLPAPTAKSSLPEWAGEPPPGVILKGKQRWDKNTQQVRESGRYAPIKYSAKLANKSKQSKPGTDDDIPGHNRGGIVKAIDMARGYFTGGSVRRFADGGVPGLDAPEDPHIPHGPVVGPDGGRDDTRPVSVPSGSFIIPADVVAGLGGGNTQAGFAELDRMFGTAETTHMATGGEVPAVPIRISDGEYVISPAKVAEIGGGDLNVGHKALDKLMIQLRQQNIKQLQSLPPPAKG